MDKRKAYEIVMKDLMKNSVFYGNFDAKNGDIRFMYGVQTVMEEIAYNCNPVIYEVFNDYFTDNLIKSIDKVNKE